MSVADLAVRLKSRWYDWLRDGGLAAEVQANLLAMPWLLAPSRTLASATTPALTALTTALRRTRSPGLRARLERAIEPFTVGPRANVWREQQIGWSRVQDETAQPRLVKSLILKAPPGNGEKGVLYISFELNWLRLMRHHDLAAILRDYLLVGASSSSPPDFMSLLALANLSDDPAFIQISNQLDLEWMRICAPTIVPIAIMASDWINPDLYVPRPHASRSVDLLMVAGWSRLKAHWLLFRSLREMSPSYRTVLVGQDMDGRTADDVWREAKAEGVASRIEIVRDAPPDLVTSYQCDSRVSVVLSRREGASVVVTESLMADTPVVMMEGAHVGTLRYINRQTGRLTTKRSLPRDLTHVLETSGQFKAREWALANVTAQHSTARLNALLKEYSLAHGKPWTRDIVPMSWRPDPVYVNEGDEAAMQPAYDELHRKHGVFVRNHPPTGFPRHDTQQ